MFCTLIGAASTEQTVTIMEQAATMKIMSLGDDVAQDKLIETSLGAAGHDVRVFKSGRLGIRHLESATVDLIVLDWETSDLSGLEVLGWVRSRIGTHLPVLMLTGSERESDVVRAFNAGADVCMVKPVRREELVARVRFLLLRAYPGTARNAQRIAVGDYIVDLHRRVVIVDGRTLKLTPREFDLASLLFQNVGRIVPREQLYKMVWGKNTPSESRSLDTHVYRLRQKLELTPEHGARLRAVYLHGYCLEEITVQRGE
jgi:two-component system phosphate regulon response regulator PhoB